MCINVPLTLRIVHGKPERGIYEETWAGMIDSFDNYQSDSFIDDEVDRGYERDSGTVRKESQRLVLKEKLQHTGIEEQQLSLV